MWALSPGLERIQMSLAHLVTGRFVTCKDYIEEIWDWVITCLSREGTLRRQLWRLWPFPEILFYPGRSFWIDVPLPQASRNLKGGPDGVCFAAPLFSDASLESRNNKIQLRLVCIFSFKASAARESTFQGYTSAMCLFCIFCNNGVI